ncbi:MAG: right-handed parallel beta-helix repeat-containing protein, partial [Gaiellaceae bacterium]
MLRVLALLLVVASAAAVAVESRAVPASAEGPQTVLVGSDVAFAAAAARLRGSGGRIVLRPGLYRRLVIGPRSGRELRIVGSRGTRVERILFWRTTRVSLGRLTVGPIGGDALIDLEGARDIDLHDLVVTARGSGRSASILIAYARQVTIRRSVFTHCGDFSPDFVNCVLLYRGAHNVVIEDNRFHDCRGCDFIHGRFGSSLTIRRNRFDRALPCQMGRYRCGHNDLVQLFAGQWLRVEQNRFGVYREGGAQLYLTDDVDHAT